MHDVFGTLTQGPRMSSSKNPKSSTPDLFGESVVQQKRTPKRLTKPKITAEKCPSLQSEPDESHAPQGTRSHLESVIQPIDECYLSYKSVGKRLEVSRQTIWRWVKDDPEFPKPYHFSSGAARWKLSELSRFEASRNAQRVCDKPSTLDAIPKTESKS